MQSYWYSLIRYVKNPKRMEPRNIGILILVNQDIIQRSSTHKVDSTDIEECTKWLDLINRELISPEMPLYKPPKTSSCFFSYLDSLQDGKFQISRAFIGEIADFTSLDNLADYLYQELVL